MKKTIIQRLINIIFPMFILVTLCIGFMGREPLKYTLSKSIVTISNPPVLPVLSDQPAPPKEPAEDTVIYEIYSMFLFVVLSITFILLLLTIISFIFDFKKKYNKRLILNIYLFIHILITTFTTINLFDKIKTSEIIIIAISILFNIVDFIFITKKGLGSSRKEEHYYG